MKGHREHPSKERLDELLRYEPETGKLYWRVSRGGGRAGNEAGRVNKGYIGIQIDGKDFQAHNLIWIMAGKQLPERSKTVDHRDRNPLNNRISNLREATPEQQALNKCIRGFSRSGSKWKARSGVTPLRHIGTYSTALQARLAYEKATSEIEPEFASTFFTDAFNELIASAS